MESLGLSPQLAERTVVAGPVELDLDTGHAVVGGTPVWFTPRELAVLRCLMSRADRVVPREAIHEAVWGPVVAGFKDRSVEVHIVRLRRKLAAACPHFTYIHTHHRVGYRFDPVPESPAADGRRRP